MLLVIGNKNLKDNNINFNIVLNPQVGDLIAETDKIKNLETEIKKCKRGGDLLEATNKNSLDHNEDLRAEIDKLRKDISRLRNSGATFELKEM